MHLKLIRRVGVVAAAGLAASALTATAATVTATAAPSAAGRGGLALLRAPTSTPIKHVVIIIGENHTFDNVFATYQPPGRQHIQDLLSEGIVTKDGTPGPKFGSATQLTATQNGKYTLTPTVTGSYKTLPAPNTTYVSPACDGLPGNSDDTRFPTLPAGPFQITKSVPYFDTHLQYAKQGQCELYGAYVGDPIHRFYQMWQQSASNHYRLATWVANTAGVDNDASPPAHIYQGGLSMGYYNMAQGDAP